MWLPCNGDFEFHCSKKSFFFDSISDIPNRQGVLICVCEDRKGVGQGAGMEAGMCK